MSAAYPCKRCKMSFRNSVHVRKDQFGYHEHEAPEEDYSNFSQEAIENSIRASLDRIRQETGATEEELMVALNEVAGGIMNINMLKEPNGR